MKNLDKIQGCLIGGAAGDAMGYPVEFLNESRIFARYGSGGITEYALEKDVAKISDDTQMTMFTANGLLAGIARGHSLSQLTQDIATAYKEWYRTQVLTFRKGGGYFCWLMHLRELYDLRAPGNTCMSSIECGCQGTMENPGNHSKGCGGVMRVAPIGLVFDETEEDLAVARLGGEAAALTHGHELGYIPAALLTHIIRNVSLHENVPLRDAVLQGLEAMKALFPKARHLTGYCNHICTAMDLAEDPDMDDLTAIHKLGPGWYGDEALAVAIYCALKYQNDFDSAIAAAVNHGGDSDSTGAIAGNILGAYLGLSRIPEKYRQNLELEQTLMELGEDLFRGCCEDPVWQDKYLRGLCPGIME